MNEGYEMLRGERRSFFCSNKLWKELKGKTKYAISISTYIRRAIIEKMINEEPEKEEYFLGLL